MIFMGPLFRREQESEIRRKTRIGSSNASNSFQWSILEGLAENLEQVTVINALPVGTWPRQYGQAVLPDVLWTWKGAACHEVGCINIPVMKQWGRYLRTGKLLRGLRNEKILLCTTYMPFLWALSRLDRSNEVTVIVTDLPEYADMHRVSGLHRFFRRLHNRMVYRFLNRADRFVLLTEQMKTPLGVGERPYIVMEGIWGKPRSESVPGPRKRTILYSGRLNIRYGVQNLLDAFQALEDDTVELWICGNGELEHTIRAAARKDSRIRFLGFCPQEEVWKMQREVSLLVNPRQNGEDFTKYSFPSKTMEYLASGTPVLMYRLDGIPEEYDRYLHYVPGNRVEDLTAAMARVLGEDPALLEEKSRAGQAFILERKNARVQGERIRKLMM